MSGIQCFTSGFSLIRQPGIRQFVIVPAIINTIVLIVLLGFAFSEFDGWMQALSGYIPDWLDFLESIIWFLSAVALLFVLLYAFTIIANIIGSPFNALLSEKVEERLTGEKVVAISSIWMLLPRAVGREISKLLYLLPRLLGLVLLSFVPVINGIAPLVWMLFGAWMMAVQYADYAADNNEVSFKDLRTRLGKSRMQSVMFGVPAYLLLTVPLLNLVLMPVAVAGGTAFWVEYLRRPVN